MNPEGIPYFSPGFPNPGSAALVLDFNPEWVAYRKEQQILGTHAGKRQAGFPPAPPRCRDEVYSSYLPA